MGASRHVSLLGRASLVALAGVALGAGAVGGLAVSRIALGRRPVGSERPDPRPHHLGTAADTRADRAIVRRCAAARYRRAHAARCPSAGVYPAALGHQRAADIGPAADGRWSAAFPVPSTAINAAVLPTGKVLLYGYPGGAGNTSQAFLWNPADGTAEEVDPPAGPDGSPVNLFCSGQALLGDGRLLVAGGNLAYAGPSDKTDFGSKGLYLFDPFTETWTRQPDMAHGRWYPTVTALPDGRAVIVTGTDETGQGALNRDVEVFTPNPNPARQGTIQTVASHKFGLYPHGWVLPRSTVAGAGGDKVLYAGPDPEDSAILSTSTWSFRSLPHLSAPRSWASGVLMPSGPNGATKAMVMGGAAKLGLTPPVYPPADTSSEVLDLNAPSAGWRPGPPLVTARAHQNTVILPDGALVTIGGGGGTTAPTATPPSDQYVDPVFGAEVMDGGGGTWRPAPSQAEARTYHGTAVLLPDGRVLSAGDTRPAHLNGNTTGEIYSPPYLFRGPRPAIAATASAVGYGTDFTLVTPQASGIARAVLIAPGADTHANDMSERSIDLAMMRGDGFLALRSPADPSLAPPGYYMLFVVDGQGVPSVARWVRLARDLSAPVGNPAPPVAGAAVGAPAPPVATTARPVPTSSTPVAPRPLLRVRPRWRGSRLYVRLSSLVRGSVALRLLRGPKVVGRCATRVAAHKTSICSFKVAKVAASRRPARLRLRAVLTPRGGRPQRAVLVAVPPRR